MFAKAVAAATVVAGVSLATASPADADQWDFVSFLDNNGVYYTGGVSAAIQLGKVVCSTLRSGVNPGVVFDAVEDRGFSVNEAALIIVGATTFMCPDQTARVDAWANSPTPGGQIT